MHWDLRLERDGVLASWAVPKGIPSDPKRNHLAVHTEDHPIEYLTFHGEIPKGEYGGGSMLLWDTGTYETEKWSDREVMITFHGERVQGKYVLFQTRGRPVDDPPDGSAGRSHAPRAAARICDRCRRRSPRHRTGDGWAWELKWDGIRALGFVDGGRIRLVSRNGNDVTRRYPELRRLGEALGTHEVILDGEIVASDDAGRPSFERLQQRMHVESDSTIRRLVNEVPVVVRAVRPAVGQRPFAPGSAVRGSARPARRPADSTARRGRRRRTRSATATTTVDISTEFGLEGVVAKRLDSRYEPGRRSRAWIKVKNRCGRSSSSADGGPARARGPAVSGRCGRLLRR